MFVQNVAIIGLHRWIEMNRIVFNFEYVLEKLYNFKVP